MLKILGNCYLMSIGSGDLLINFCSHYWDGGDVKIFDEGQKKKTLDFAHRNSITGSCIGFAFRPVDTESVTTDDYMAKLDEEKYVFSKVIVVVYCCVMSESD